MIAALGNPKPFDNPRAEIELYSCGARVHRCQPLGPNAARMATTGAPFYGSTEHRASFEAATRFSSAAVAEAQIRRTTRLHARKQWASQSQLQETRSRTCSLLT